MLSQEPPRWQGERDGGCDPAGLCHPQVLGPPPCVFGPGAPLLPLGPIVDVLQYTQKDLDAAVRTRRGDRVHVTLGRGLAESWVGGRLQEACVAGTSQSLSTPTCGPYS